jgi:phosphoglycerate dehydrogenase-like enzyme
MKIIFHFAAGTELTAQLAAQKAQNLDVVIIPEADDAALTAALPDTEVLWHVLKPCTAEMIAAAPKLRLIQKIGVGVNTIDLDAARARGIAVCNLPGSNARAVAELTLALMFSTLRRLPAFDAATRAGRGWALDPAMQDGLGELGGKTVGLVGYGAIPQALAPVLKALGCAVIYTARSPHADVQDAYRSLDALLAEADIVSLHVPLDAQTDQMIGRDALARMRPGAILINTARGGLVDPAALADALCSGHLAAAGLDVFAAEPPDPADPLLALPNVVLTPHIGWLTTQTFSRSFRTAAENCRRLAGGEPLLHQVA